MNEHMSAADFRKLLSKPQNKYHAERVKTDDGDFDSKGEAERFGELKWLEMAGKISDLDRQVKIQLTPRVVWKIDFSYTESGRKVLEDFKGHRGRDYIVKRNLLMDLIDAGKMDVIFRESMRSGIIDYPLPKQNGGNQKCRK